MAGGAEENATGFCAATWAAGLTDGLEIGAVKLAKDFVD